jgi:hypothetical protein
MAMLEADETHASAEVAYTLTPQTSIGLISHWDRAHDWQAQALTASILLFRDNQEKSQANVFAQGGLGVAHADLASFGAEDGLFAFATLEADWETRRLYVQGKVSARFVDEAVRNGHPAGASWRARAGIAPILVPAGDLQPWLIAQLDHAPDAKDPVTPRAVLRLFSGPMLIEAGVSDKGAANAVFWFYF